jgi:hypothetical protein
LYTIFDVHYYLFYICFLSLLLRERVNERDRLFDRERLRLGDRDRLRLGLRERLRLGLREGLRLGLRERERGGMVGVLVIDGLGDEVCDWLDVHVIDELGLYDSW